MKYILKIIQLAQILFHMGREQGIRYTLKQSIKVALMKYTVPIQMEFGATVNFTQHVHEEKSSAMQQIPQTMATSFSQKISIAKHTVCVYGQECNFTDTTTVILAHWDPEQRIDPYVEHICRNFRTMGFKVILSSAQTIKKTLVFERWARFIDAIVYRTCDGLACASWKAAFTYFPSLYACKEVILIQDSFMGSLDFFVNMHQHMREVHCDFWGLSYTRFPTPHVQNLYLVLKKSVLQDSSFTSFIQAIPLSNYSKKQNFLETSFTHWLCAHGFTAGVYCMAKNAFWHGLDLTDFFWKLLPKNHAPFIKRENLYTKEGYYAFIEQKEKFSTEMFEAIQAYVLRMGSLPVTAKSFGVRNSFTPQGKRHVQYPHFPQSVLALYTPLVPEMAAKPVSMPQSLAIAVHCFYPESLYTVTVYLANIPSHAHIYVTTNTEEKKEIILQKLKDFSFEKLEVRICPNVGFDMAPFFITLQDVLVQYEYVLKIHVKKSLQMKEDVGALWRDLLYTSLMGSQKCIEYIFTQFYTNPHLGVIAAPNFPPSSLPIQGVNHTLLHTLLQKKGIDLPEDACIDFPVGGMFWCRSKVLRPWLELSLTYEDFKNEMGQRDGTMAHALERSIFFGCGLEGLQWSRIRWDVLEDSID